MWNRIPAFMIIMTASSLLLAPLDIEARGGGRGGGGGGGGGRSAGGAKASGGAYVGGHTMNRTPTMSRASSRPSTPQARQQIQTRPSVSQGRVQPARQPSRPPLQQRPTTANRTELRNQVNQYAKSRPAQNIDSQALKQKAQNFTSNRGNQMTQNRQFSDQVSQRLQQSRPGSNQWFNQNFFDQHNIGRGYVGSRANWWRPAAWATLANWGNWNWSTPYYYDNGLYAYPLSMTDSSYIYPYSSSTTYSQTIQTHPTQIDQSTASTNEEWLPLGVFAVANNTNAAAYTNRFIQLAINRNGEIAGVLYNSATDTAQDLTGMVDPTTQQAYWSLDNQTNSPIASTGIFNLTEDQTPINVHFTDGSDQTWSLVRLQQGQ